MVRVASKLFRGGLTIVKLFSPVPQEFRSLYYNHKDQTKLYIAFIQVEYVCLKSVTNKIYQSDNYEIAATISIYIH